MLASIALSRVALLLALWQPDHPLDWYCAVIPVDASCRIWRSQGLHAAERKEHRTKGVTLDS